MTGDKKKKVSANFLKGLRQHIEGIDELEKTIPSNQSHLSIPKCTAEGGWTIEPNTRRFAQHEHGPGSNKVMNVIDAATRTALGMTQDPRGYRMRWFIVVEIVQPDLAAPAERAISRLMSTYTTTHGTNQILAGISVSGANTAGNKTFLDAIKRSHPQLRVSVSELKDSLQSRATAVARFEKVSTNHTLARDLEKEIETLQELDEKEQEEADEIGEDLMKLAPDWSMRLRARLEAVQQHTRMTELEEALRDLI